MFEDKMVYCVERLLGLYHSPTNNTLVGFVHKKEIYTLLWLSECDMRFIQLLRVWYEIYPLPYHTGVWYEIYSLPYHTSVLWDSITLSIGLWYKLYSTLINLWNMEKTFITSLGESGIWTMTPSTCDLGCYSILHTV